MENSRIDDKLVFNSVTEELDKDVKKFIDKIKWSKNSNASNAANAVHI